MNMDYNKIDIKQEEGQNNNYIPPNFTLRGFARVKISRDEGDEEFFVKVEEIK